jgi:hypothetical protein
VSQFHSIFCTSGATLTRLEIATYVSEAWYGDGDPTFQPTPDDSPAWDRLEVSLPGVARPVVFLNDTDPQVVRTYATEVLQEAPVPPAPPIVAQLDRARRVIGIELAPDVLTDDAWELLDIVQSLIAVKLDGILVTHDAIYDAQLRPIGRI